jgi:hypothetical protein
MLKCCGLFSGGICRSQDIGATAAIGGTAYGAKAATTFCGIFCTDEQHDSNAGSSIQYDPDSWECEQHDANSWERFVNDAHTWEYRKLDTTRNWRCRRA